MIANVRSFLIIFALLTSSIISPSSCADDWRGTAWEEIDIGAKCYSSVKIYMKHHEDDENIRASEIEGDVAHRYILIGDYTPSKNPSKIIFQKHEDGSICQVLFIAASEDLLPKFSKTGVLEEVKTYNSIFGTDKPITEVIYRKNAKGHFLPLMCTWQYRDEKIESVSCLVALASGSSKYIKPSFNCTMTHLEADKIVCSSKVLSNLDATLAKNYVQIKSHTTRKNRQQLLVDQRAWLKQRNICQTAECLRESYTLRIGQICNDYPVTSDNPLACITAKEAMAVKKETTGE
ncbi:MAG: hypothetical protein LBI68_00715 [Azoarcus sp.]|jgi:uncharacterized protein YecT (DUF1311 family)|nr:hypothetical protein [Azoarcus sp.]